jgi:hypothetical protein
MSAIGVILLIAALAFAGWGLWKFAKIIADHMSGK